MTARERGGTTVMARPQRRTSSTRPGDRAASPRLPGGGLDLAAWVTSVLDRLDDTPAVPFKQGLVRGTDGDTCPDSAGPPAARPAGSANEAKATPRSTFDLTAWVFGIVPRRDSDEPIRPSTRGRRPAPGRKAITMPDLFDDPATPPCLRDDD